MFVQTRHGWGTSFVFGVLLALPLAVVLAISSGAQADLVGYWTFDEGTGQTVFDSSAYNNHGVLGSTASVETSDPTRVSGRLGAGALNYTGAPTFQYAIVPDSPSISVTGSLTLSAWINIAGGTGTNRNILAKEANSAYRWRIDDAQHPWLLINDGPGLALATSSYTVLEADYNEWHHVAVTFTPGGTNNVSFYYDGSLTDQKTLSKSSIADTAGSLVLGAYHTTAEPFNGSLDEIAIWNQVCTGNQIYALAQGMAATNQPTAGNTPVHWTGGIGAFEASTNWSGGAVPGATHDAYVNNGGTVQVTAATGTAAPGTLMLGGLGTGTLSLTGGTLSPGNLTVSAGGLLSLAGGTFTPTTIHLDGGTVQLSADYSSSAAVTLDPRGGTLDTGAKTLTLSGPVAGPGGFIKLGTGTLTLTGTAPNTFRGTTEIREGTLILQKSSGVTALGGNVLIGAGTADAWLRLEADQQIADSAILTFNGVKDAKFELNGHAETIGGLVMSGGLCIIQNRESGGSGTGVLTIANNTTDSTWSGYMRNSSGQLALIKDGSAKLTLAGGAITYTGPTTVSNGTLILQNTTAFNSDITNNATLQFDVTTGNSYTFGKNITGPGNLVKSGAGTLTLASSYPYTGKSIVRSGTLLVGANVLPGQNGPLGNATSAIELGDLGTGASDNIFLLTNGSFTVGRPITVNSQNTTGLTTIGGATSQTTGSIYSGTIELNRRVVYLTSSTTAPYVVDFQGDITGTGGVTTVGSGTVLFTGTKNYQGTTTVLSGTLKLGSANALPSGVGKGDVYLYATLDLGGFDATVNGLWGDGRVTNNRTTAGNNVLTVGANNASSTFSGTIQDGNQGVLGLTKTGAGTLTLTNPQTYTGATVITQGTVRLAAIAPSNAIAHYTFDDSTNLGADSAGNHHATGVTNASSATGRVGPGAVRFAGNGYIVVPYSADLALNSFTVSAWVNLSAEPTTFGILGTRFGKDYTFDLKVQSTAIHGDLGTGTAWISTTVDIRSGDFGANGQGGDLPLGYWYLVSYAVDDTAKRVDMYINGDLKRSITYSSSSTALFMQDGQTLHLGESGGGEYMNGLLDDVYIYPRALTTEEIQALFCPSSASHDFLPTTTALAIAAGATLDLNGVNQTVGSLADSGSSGGSVLLGGNATLTVGTNHASTTFSGTLSGTGNLVKTGSGALTLTGTNSYSGTTAVQAGKLLVNGTLTGTGGDVTVTGGLLGGTGSISRDVLVTLTGQISAADEGTTGTLAIGGDLTLDDGTMLVDLGGDTPSSEYDLIQVSGQTILGGTLQVALLPGFIPASQDTFNVLTSGEGIDPTGLILEWDAGSLAPAQFWTYHVLGEDGGPQTLQLMLSVPEPSAFLLGAAALAGLLGWAARRRHVSK